MEVLEDNRFFKSIGLLKEVNLSLNCSANEFRDCFEYNVASGLTVFELIRQNKEFSGTIGRSAFKMHKSMSMTNNNLSGVSGTFVEIEGKLKVVAWVYVPIGIFLLYYSIIVLINIILGNLLLSMNNHDIRAWVLPLLGLGFFMISTLGPYLSFRSGVKKLTYEVEREFNFWVTKLNQE